MLSPVEVLGDGARLVALDRPDQVPDHVGVVDLLNLVDGFGDIVFAKVPLTTADRLLNALRRHGLAHGNQLDAVGQAAGEGGGHLDAAANLGQCVGEIVHIAGDTECL